MRRMMLAGLLAGLAPPATGFAQGPDADELIRRLRDVARETQQTPAAPSAEELIRRLREATTPAGQAIATGLDPQQIRERIAAELNVEVLEVRAAEIERGPAYAVKIMNPPGNSNSAFMVGTLLVDAESGEVLGRAQDFPTFSESMPLVRDPDVDAAGPEMRRRTYR